MLDERWSDEVEEIGQALRKLLAAECSPERVRKAEAAADGRDPKLESALADFGLDDLGADVALAARVAFELGRALAPVSFVETLPARFVLDRPGIAYGFDRVVPGSVPLIAVLRDSAVTIEAVNGTPRRSTAGDWLVRHRGGGDGGEAVGDAQAADRMGRLMRLADAARLIGAGQALLELGSRYACERTQFGKQIGAYQGVAFRLVDAAIALDAAELMLRKTAYTASQANGGDGAPSPPFAIMLGVKAAEAARLVATQVHQVFGGAGFAMEYDVQLYSRRIRSWTMRMARAGPELAELGRSMLDPVRRDATRHLWHHDQGMPLPRWAQEADKAG